MDYKNNKKPKMKRKKTRWVKTWTTHLKNNPGLTPKQAMIEAKKVYHSHSTVARQVGGGRGYYQNLDNLQNKYIISDDNFGIYNATLSGLDGRSRSHLTDLSYCECEEWKESPIIFRKIAYLNAPSGVRLDIPVHEPEEAVWSTSYFFSHLRLRNSVLTSNGKLKADFEKYFLWFLVYVSAIATAQAGRVDCHIRCYLNEDTYYQFGKILSVLNIYQAINNFSNKWRGQADSHNHVELVLLMDKIAHLVRQWTNKNWWANGNNDKNLLRDKFWCFVYELSGRTIHLYTYKVNDKFNKTHNTDMIGQIIRYMPLIQKRFAMLLNRTTITQNPPTSLHICDAHATIPTEFMFNWLNKYWFKRILAGHSSLYNNVQHHNRVGMWAGLFNAKRETTNDSIFTAKEWINTYGRVFCRITNDFFTTCHSNQKKLLIRNMDPIPLVYRNTTIAGPFPANRCQGLSKTNVTNNKWEREDNLGNSIIDKRSVPHSYGNDELGASYLCLDSRGKKHTDVGCEQYLKTLGPTIQFVNCHHWTANLGSVNNKLMTSLHTRYQFIDTYMKTLRALEQINGFPNTRWKPFLNKYFDLKVEEEYQFYESLDWCRYLKAKQLHDTDGTKDLQPSYSITDSSLHTIAVSQSLRENFDHMSEISYTVFRYLNDLILILIISSYVIQYNRHNGTGFNAFTSIDVSKPIYVSHIISEMTKHPDLFLFNTAHTDIDINPNTQVLFINMCPTICWHFAMHINSVPQYAQMSVRFDVQQAMNMQKHVTGFLQTHKRIIDLLIEHIDHNFNNWWILRPIKNAILDITDERIRNDIIQAMDYTLEEKAYKGTKCPKINPQYAINRLAKC